MIDWTGYVHRLHSRGETRRERILSRTRDKILGEVDKHPGCAEVLVDDVPQYIFTKRTDEPTKIAFNTLPGETVALGAVIYWQDRHWLVTESLSSDRMTVYGAFELCNRQLVWQNPKTREIIRRWCTIKKPYYSNLDTSDTLTVSGREFKVQIPSDYESNQLNVDSRFMLEVINGDAKVYKCISMDMNSKRYDVEGETAGFLILNLEQDQYDPSRDSIEYGVCNYLPPFDDLHETQGGWCIIETSASGVPAGGLPVTVSARYFDADGLPLDEEKTAWTVDASPEVLEALSEQRRDNGTLRLSVADNVELIGETIEIAAANEGETIQHKITLKVVSIL